VASTLAGFNQLAVLHDVPRSHMMIFATEAMRRASNAAQMLEAIAQATDGLGVNILEPAVETLFGAVMGSRSGLVNVHNGAMFLDLGGGSVQMTWVDTSLEDYEIKAATAGISMPFGAAKLTRILEQNNSALHETEVGNLRSLMQNAYSNLCQAFPKLEATRAAYGRGEDASIDVYMCGGGFRGYGSMLMHHDSTTPYPIPSIGTYTVDATSFKRTAELRTANQDDKVKIFGMSRRRRQQFHAISTVVESFIATVPNIRQVTFCKGSNRDGALMMLLPREIRESNPLDAVAIVSHHDKEFLDEVTHILAQAIPRGSDLSDVPTVLSHGLHTLFTQQIWERAGLEADTNASYALHHAISRDSHAPGLTHTARAALGLTLAARWATGFCPADAYLVKGLRSILNRQHADAIFWAQYIGAISRVLVTVCPVRPKDIHQLKTAIKCVSLLMLH
jgi:retrograde regulation protein 2